MQASSIVTTTSLNVLTHQIELKIGVGDCGYEEDIWGQLYDVV